MRWCIFGTDFFVCDCEKLKMYWMYIEFFGKKQAGKDVSKMCRRINQWFLRKIGEQNCRIRRRCRSNKASRCRAAVIARHAEQKVVPQSGGRQSPDH